MSSSLFSVAGEKLVSSIPPDAPLHVRQQIIAEAKRQAACDVFGVDHKTDRHGKPIEQGLGAAGNQTAQSVEAYEKWCRHEPGFDRNLARMKKELADCEAKRAAAE